MLIVSSDNFLTDLTFSCQLVSLVVHHVIALQGKLLTRWQCLTWGEELRDGEHLFVPTRMVAWHHQKILQDPMIPARHWIDVLDVLGRLVVQNRADKKLHGFLEVSLSVKGDVAVLLVDAGREVIFHHLAPGSFVTACKNIIEF